MDHDRSPLEPHQLDDLLSAELDREFDAAAADLGLTATEAAQRIRATPGADARRAALSGARDLLATPPELDELLEARLRAKAVRAAVSAHAAHADARRQRRRNIVLSIGSVAATLALVVAVAAGIGHKSSSADKSSAATEPNRAPADASVASPSKTARTRVHTAGLGAFTDSHALALAAVARDAEFRSSDQVATSKSTLPPDLAKNSNDATTTIVQPESSGLSTTEAPTTRTKSSSTTTGATTGKSVSLGSSVDSGTTGAGGAPCVAPPQVPVGDPLVLRATASLSGTPVIVLLFQADNEHVVVVEDPHCKLISLQMLS